MERSVRIAVVGRVADDLVGALRQLPLQPQVRSFPSVCDDSDALVRFHPELLLAQLGPEPAEEIGAMRLLRQLWPTLAIVLVTSPAGELHQTAHAARIGARLLLYPHAPGQLAAIVEQALQGSDRPRAEVFVDLAHGIADEINNPLMFLSGHLQLLRASLDPTTDAARRGQVDAAMQGIGRIQASVDRLRLLSSAAGGPRRREVVDLADLVQQAIARRARQQPEQAQVHLPSSPCRLDGDADQLAAAAMALLEFADGLARGGAAVQLELLARAGVLQLRLTAAGDALQQWRLPQTFEPYYPSRLLQGHSHGLALFLVQTVVLGHRGQATARRTDDEAIVIDFLLPA